MNYNHVPKLTANSSQFHDNVNRKRKLTMNSLDLCVSRKCILAKLATNAALLVASKWNSKVAVLRAVDLLSY